MPIVTMPDGKVVDLPDQLPPEDLALLDKIHGSSNLEEMGKVADQTLRGGVLALPNLIKSGVGLVGKGEQAVESSGDVGKRVIEATNVTPVGRMMQLVRMAQSSPEESLYDKLSTPSKPTTEAGKAAGNIGEAVVGTFASPGGFAKPGMSLLQGAASGAGGELGARLLGGDSAIGRIVGALLGGSAPAAARTIVPNADTLMKQAISKVPEADWRQAKSMEKTLKDSGISHLSSQLLGNRSTLDDLVSSASAHPAVRPQILSAIEKAPQEAQTAFNIWKDQHLPVGVDETKSILNDVQQAAQNRLSSIKGKANAAYTAALPPGTSESTYASDKVKTIAAALEEAALDPNTLGPHTTGGKLLSSLSGDLKSLASQKSGILGPDGLPIPKDVPKGYINSSVKELGDRAFKEGYSGLATAKGKGILAEGSPEFQAAREAKSKVMTEELNPAQKGLTGELAGMGGGVRPDKATAKMTALSLVFPQDVAQPAAIRELGKQIGGEGVGELLREHLSRSMQKAVTLTAESNKAQQPFSFLKTVAGTDAQRKNLDAALITTSEAMGANPFAARNGFYKLMKAFDTFKDLKIASGVDKAALGQQASSNTLGKLIAPQTGVRRWQDFLTSEKTFKRIAEVVTSKDGLAQLEALAKTQDPSIIGRYAASLVSAANSLEATDPAQPAP